MIELRLSQDKWKTDFSQNLAKEGTWNLTGHVWKMAYIRTLLEVLKWTEPQSVLKHFAIVAQVWRRACATDELWSAFCEDCDIVPDPGTSPTAAFREGRPCLDLLVLQGAALSQFNCKTKEIVTLIQFQQGLVGIYTLAAVLLPSGSLLCCGGNSNNAVLIEASGSQMQLQNMLCHRSFHSAVHFKGIVYVFGGAESTAEKLVLCSVETLPSQPWLALPNMQCCRSACSPCLYRGKFYLFGGNSNRCEMFSPLTEEFTMLSLVLPEIMYGCVAFHTRKGFLLLSAHYVTHWSVGEAPVSLKNPENIPGIWTCMQQCMYGGVVYSAEKGAIRVFDLATQVRTVLTKFC